MKVTTVGIDLAKNLFQVHGVDAHGKTGSDALADTPRAVPLSNRSFNCRECPSRSPCRLGGR
jgi:hypothetical protein